MFFSFSKTERVGQKSIKLAQHFPRLISQKKWLTVPENPHPPSIEGRNLSNIETLLSIIDQTSQSYSTVILWYNNDGCFLLLTRSDSNCIITHVTQHQSINYLSTNKFRIENIHSPVSPSTQVRIVSCLAIGPCVMTQLDVTVELLNKPNLNTMASVMEQLVLVDIVPIAGPCPA